MKNQFALFSCAGVALLLVGFLPLFAGPSYEFALACGVILPLFGAGFNAAGAALRGATPASAFFDGLRSGLVLCGLALAVALLHGARAGFCEPWGELSYFALGPLPGALLGSVWGALCGAFVCGLSGGGRRWRAAVAVLLASSAPLLGIALSLLRYYTSPIIFAFDPFFGYFSGTLYDTVIDGTERLLTYRAGTLGWMLVLFGVATVVTRSAEGGLEVRWRDRQRAVAAGLVGAALGLGVWLAGPELGHFQTAGSIRERLGHVAISERCEVVYASGIPQREAHALARECDGHIEQQERYFDVEGPLGVTVYLFASASQKARLMGARDVYIAKPWRGEIYIQTQGYPHPVLGHELAHVVAGSFARGPFLVAGPLGGWVPDPGRIEGVAVAASPRHGDDLTLLEWAASMRKLENLPPLERLFRLGFLGENSSKAYTVAGAFIHWLRENHGIASVKAWYGGATLEEATQHGLADLEQAFVADLEQVKVSSEAMAVARARFERPAIFGRRCPHQVDQLVREAGRALNGFDPERARLVYEQVLGMDPNHFAAKVGVGRCAFHEGDLEAAKRTYEALRNDDRTTATEQAWLAERLGDLAFVDGHFKIADSRFAEAEKLLVDQDQLRTLEVKRAVSTIGTHPELARRAVGSLLVGEPKFGADWSVAAPELGRWAQADEKSGLAEYLIGKNLYGHGRWEAAVAALDTALARDLNWPLVRAEAVRARLHLACALGQKQAATQASELVQASKVLSPARRLDAQRFAERCGAVSVQSATPASSKASAEP